MTNTPNMPNMLTAKVPLGEYLKKVIGAAIVAKKGVGYNITVQSASVTRIEATVVTPDGEHQIIFIAKPEPAGLYWSAEASPPLL